MFSQRAEEINFTNCTFLIQPTYDRDEKRTARDIHDIFGSRDSYFDINIRSCYTFEVWKLEITIFRKFYDLIIFYQERSYEIGSNSSLNRLENYSINPFIRGSYLRSNVVSRKQFNNFIELLSFNNFVECSNKNSELSIWRSTWLHGQFWRLLTKAYRRRTEVRAGMDVQVCVDEQCASGAKNKEEERGSWSHMSENVNHVQIHEVSRL